MSLANMILLVVSLLVLIGAVVSIKLGFERNNPDDICAMSATMSSVSSDLVQGKHLMDFKCPVRQWTFQMGKMGEIELGESEAKKNTYIGTKSSKLQEYKWYVPFSKNEIGDFNIGLTSADQMTKEATYNEILSNLQEKYYVRLNEDPKKFRVMDQQDFMNEQIALRMYRCSTKLGEGNLNIFDNWFKDTKTLSFCVVCDTFDFSEVGKEIDGNDRLFLDGKGKDCVSGSDDCYPKVKTLDEWMKLWKIPGEDLSFFDYFAKINGEESLFDDYSEYDYEISRQENGETVYNEYAIVYLETDMSAVFNKISNAAKKLSWKDVAVVAGTAAIGFKGFAFTYAALQVVTADARSTQDRRILLLPTSSVSALCDEVVNM